MPKTSPGQTQEHGGLYEDGENRCRKYQSQFIPLMWYSPLYAVNMFYYQCSIKNAFGSMAGQIRDRWGYKQRYRKTISGVKEMPCSC